MLDKEVLSQVKLEDFPQGDLRLVAEVMGIDFVYEMIEKCSGVKIYIPKGGMFLFKRRFVLENHFKFSPKELALKLRVTENWVYSVLRDGNKDPAQLTIFEDRQQTKVAGVK